MRCLDTDEKIFEHLNQNRVSCLILTAEQGRLIRIAQAVRKNHSLKKIVIDWPFRITKDAIMAIFDALLENQSVIRLVIEFHSIKDSSINSLEVVDKLIEVLKKRTIVVENIAGEVISNYRESSNHFFCNNAVIRAFSAVNLKIIQLKALEENILAREAMETFIREKIGYFNVRIFFVLCGLYFPTSIIGKLLMVMLFWHLFSEKNIKNFLNKDRLDLSPIQYIDLSDTCQDDESLEKLIDFLLMMKIKMTRELNFEDNYITNKSLPKLATLLTFHPQIYNINLSHNLIASESWVEFNCFFAETVRMAGSKCGIYLGANYITPQALQKQTEDMKEEFRYRPGRSPLLERPRISLFTGESGMSMSSQKHILKDSRSSKHYWTSSKHYWTNCKLLYRESVDIAFKWISTQEGHIFLARDDREDRDRQHVMLVFQGIDPKTYQVFLKRAHLTIADSNMFRAAAGAVFGGRRNIEYQFLDPVIFSRSQMHYKWKSWTVNMEKLKQLMEIIEKDCTNVELYQGHNCWKWAAEKLSQIGIIAGDDNFLHVLPTQQLTDQISMDEKHCIIL